ncbi:MFS transporter [Pseudokineococcus basanitobsidens]|uniref:MFS transporter n=1 Tax=Pseudokineococcus basanitobsidens TaxID=1926649 RepID=A0ABU8RLJ6_9ACTN
MSSSTTDGTAGGPGGAAPAVSPRRAVAAAFSGAFLEWYDFYLFGTASALVFPQLFFPESSPTAGTIASFGAFAAGFVTRPIGAVLFGHFGDRIGRKPMLLLTILVMGLGTALMGVLPTFDSVGLWAAALLIGLRLVQGLGIGGEFGGGSLVALENAPRHRRGVMGSIHQVGTPVGLLVSSGVFALVQLLPEDAFLSWGWRIPFLLGGAFLVVAFTVRRHLPETEAFREDATQVRRLPVLSLLREQPKDLGLAVGARMTDAVTFNIINVFGIAYATSELGLPDQLMLTGFVIAAAVEVALLPVVGHVSDRVGRRPVYLFGIVVCAVMGVVYFPLLATGQTWVVWLTIVVTLAVGTGCMFGIQGVLFSEMFATRMRYTGLGVAYQLSALLGGAPTPIIATALAAATGSVWPVVAYLLVVCAISFACVRAAGETSRRELVDEPAR